jgi:hypothetical protein
MPSLSNTVSKLLHVLSTARKSDVDAIAEDLNDSVDVTRSVFDNPHMVPNQREVPKSPNEGASGGRGVDKWVSDFMDGAEAATSRNNKSPAALLGEMVGRQEKLEKCMLQLAEFLGKAFPSDEGVDADDDKKDAEDETSTTKAALAKISDALEVQQISLKSLFDRISGISQSVAEPPSMIRKARAHEPVVKSKMQILEEQIEKEEDTGARITKRVQLNAMRIQAAGKAMNPNDPRLSGFDPNGRPIRL